MFDTVSYPISIYVCIYNVHSVTNELLKKGKKKLVNLKKCKTLPDVSRKEDLDIHLKKF